MDMAKKSEWVKLIDCDYESEVKVWLRLIQKKYYEMEFAKKSQGLESRFLVWKHEEVCTMSMSSLRSKCEKVLGHNEDEWVRMESKASQEVHFLRSYEKWFKGVLWNGK
jgi:hypothetical protein